MHAVLPLERSAHCNGFFAFGLAHLYFGVDNKSAALECNDEKKLRFGLADGLFYF